MTPEQLQAASWTNIQEVLEGFASGCTEFGENYDEAFARAQTALAAHDAEVARQQVEKIAGFLDVTGVLWHGDDGVTVYADGPYGGNRMKLTDWLRAQFPEETK